MNSSATICWKISREQCSQFSKKIWSCDQHGPVSILVQNYQNDCSQDCYYQKVWWSALFIAVAHWVVSIRMTHGQLCILYLCSDWMLWWGEGGEDSHTARKIVMRSNIPICHIWEPLSDHLRCYINYLQNWYFTGLLEVWYKVADID